MDNIQKSIIGCLGFVGLIVMIVPNSDPIAKKEAQANAGAVPQPPSTAAPAPPPPQPGQNDSPQNGAENVVFEDYDIGSFGEPMVDPTPPGQRGRQNQQQQEFQPQQNNGGQSQIPNGTENAGPPPPPIIEGTAG